MISGRVRFPAPPSPFFFKSILAMLVSLPSHIHVGMTLSNCRENPIANSPGNKIYRVDWRGLANSLTGDCPPATRVRLFSGCILPLLCIPSSDRGLPREWASNPFSSFSAQLNASSSRKSLEIALTLQALSLSSNPSQCPISWTLSTLGLTEGATSVPCVPIAASEGKGLHHLHLCTPSGTHGTVDAQWALDDWSLGKRSGKRSV